MTEFFTVEKFLILEVLISRTNKRRRFEDHVNMSLSVFIFFFIFKLT